MRLLVACLAGAPADISWTISERWRVATLQHVARRRARVWLDADEAAHSARVSKLAGRVARVLGLPTADRQLVSVGGLLHDVGKSAVPSRILRKASALTADEWEALKAHVVIGAQRAGEVDARVAMIVRAHHEYYDGRGYPDGVRGLAIPIGARIICAVDTLDALTTDRPYRRALSSAEALTEMRAHAGTMFDPRIITALESIHRAPGAD